MEKENQLKTGTTTIGLICKDGLVLAADKRATAGNLIVDKKALKIHILEDQFAITTAGSVSDIQLLLKLLRAELALKRFKTNRRSTVKEAANLMSGMVFNNIRVPSMLPGITHFIVGGFDDIGFHLYDLFPDGSLTEIDEFIASGSGSVMAYGVLETLYSQNQSVDEGVKLALKAINAALSRDNASGSGIDIVTITKDGVKKVFSKPLLNKIEA
jgi:proteasome beta subunit